MQGWCFVFRPFDRPGYVGVYSSSNLNALFYLEVLAAVFTKKYADLDEFLDAFVGRIGLDTPTIFICSMEPILVLLF